MCFNQGVAVGRTPHDQGHRAGGRGEGDFYGYGLLIGHRVENAVSIGHQVREEHHSRLRLAPLQGVCEFKGDALFRQLRHRMAHVGVLNVITVSPGLVAESVDT